MSINNDCEDCYECLTGYIIKCETCNPPEIIEYTNCMYCDKKVILKNIKYHYSKNEKCKKIRKIIDLKKN